MLLSVAQCCISWQGVKLGERLARLWQRAKFAQAAGASLRLILIALSAQGSRQRLQRPILQRLNGIHRLAQHLRGCL